MALPGDCCRSSMCERQPEARERAACRLPGGDAGAGGGGATEAPAQARHIGPVYVAGREDGGDQGSAPQFVPRPPPPPPSALPRIDRQRVEALHQRYPELQVLDYGLKRPDVVPRVNPDAARKTPRVTAMATATGVTPSTQPRIHSFVAVWSACSSRAATLVRQEEADAGQRQDVPRRRAPSSGVGKSDLTLGLG